MKTGFSFVKYVIIVSITTLSVGCRKDNTEQIPVVTTFNVTGITDSSAVCGGTVINDGGVMLIEGEIGGGANLPDDGGAPIKERGLCWSDVKTPTINENRTVDGKGLGTFTSELTGLTSNTVYRVRAYATNYLGTGYGNEVVFRTSNKSFFTSL